MTETIRAKVIAYRENLFQFENLTADGNRMQQLLSKIPYLSPYLNTAPHHTIKFPENPGWSKGDIVTITVEKTGDTA